MRSFLEANKIPFEIVEVHPITKKEMKFSEYKKVPVVMAEYDGNNYVSFIITNYLLQGKASCSN